MNDKLFFQDKLSHARKRGVRKQELSGIDQELSEIKQSS